MDEQKLLSIIIPIFNEEKTLAEVVEKVINLGKNNISIEIIIVDDGSQDRSWQIIQTLAKQYPNLIISLHQPNQGKGAAIKNGLNKTSGLYTIIQDADLEYNPDEIPKLLQAARDSKNIVIYGSRNLMKHRSASSVYYFGAWLMTFCGNRLYRQKITDQYTCYKLIRTDILKKINLESKGFELEAEITAKLSRLGYKIKELPITYQPRSKKEGKKIKFKDAVIGLFTLLKYVTWQPANKNE